MNTKLLLEYSMIAVFVLSLVTLGLMWWRRAFRDYYFVAAFLIAMAMSRAIAVPLLFFRKYLGFSKVFAYKIYLDSSWAFFVIEYVIVLLIIYTVFSVAMQPFEGLHRAGKLVFRWVSCVSVILSFGIAMGPHLGSGFQVYFTSAIQQAMGILALCLLLFVTFSTRYLGLTYRSRLFGISLGFGVWATSALIESALYTSTQVKVYSPVYLWGALGSFATISIWAFYFAMPEPERKLILLPTTSPFFFWNRISEALGDDPGHVVVGGFKPEMLAPGELQVLTAASRTAKAKVNNESSTAPSPALQSIAAQH